MSKLIVSNMMSLDGFFEGPGHEIDWHIIDKEFHDFSDQQLKDAGLLIFGRVTYELMFGYWPTQQAFTKDPLVAALMNSIPKIVFSTTMTEARWNNTRLIRENVEKEIIHLKKNTTRDILIFGSANLIRALRPSGLIDEYRIMISPVLLGHGNPLFQPVQERFNLKLVSSAISSSGNVLLTYEPGKNR
jgi:dihydrofolate reductase